MKLFHSILALAMVLSAAPAFALEAGSSAASMQHTDHCGLPVGEGTVTALDVKTSKATIDHGPIAALDWDAMTMDFKAAKGVDLAAFAAGDRVHFLLAEDAKSKSYRIEAMCSLDAPEGLHDACMGKMHETAMSAAEASGKPCAMEGMDHGTMPGMDHGNMKGMDHSQMPGMAPEAAPAATDAAKPAADHSQH
ncbi:putative copper resistance protein [Hyphomonas neptunium ATCC 15444]|uniref:Putative copper resistance protein n=2 Tax=Hyphomonas TaxID=85 RepID=Q0C1H9_HYPNA|nr:MULTISPECIES: copper-binding protein [Hyphomonas]ABI77292.1 putative copper resistance protein [Hyphomonas neptunium ATCC 15444]KCZ92503.1 putative copper resistance protein [Hyphomonas hirschiana VP5]OZB17843.1 MAG: copper resistance protein [Hyphomonas sp. 34-62-18]